MLETSQRVAEQPKVEQALRAGELSPAKVALVAGAVEIVPDAADGLLELAKTAPLAKVKEEGLRAKASVGRDETHVGRAPTVAQKAALWWRSPTCDVLGCPRTQRLEIDHDTGWATTHTTRVDDANCLCDHHHDLKTYFGWAMVEGTGPRDIVPPDDPRHPKNKPK